MNQLNRTFLLKNESAIIEKTDKKNKDINKRVEEINSTIKTISKELHLISKLAEAKKERELWELRVYSDITSSLSEIQEKTRSTLNQFETCGIDWFDNWSLKVQENKILISKVKKEIEKELKNNDK